MNQAPSRYENITTYNTQAQKLAEIIKIFLSQWSVFDNFDFLNNNWE